MRALNSAATLVERVQRSLFGADGLVCSARLLARQLGMSERTLKRRLAEQNTSYTELLDAARRKRSLELLGSNASVEEVSTRLGYSDAANFTRAFRRWTGQSPRALRQTARDADQSGGSISSISRGGVSDPASLASGKLVKTRVS